MPLYEYKCQSCGHTLEAIRKWADEPLTVCPECGGDLRKLISSPAIQFKGSGFYITDYARSGKSEGTKESGNDSKSESKGEAKAGGEASSGSESKSGGESKSGSESKAAGESKSGSGSKSSSAAGEK